MPTARKSDTVCATTPPTTEVHLLLAADYPFLDIMWTMAIFFLWVAWIWVLIMALSDNFSRRDHSGGAKALWTIFIIFLPLLGVLFYMITRPAPEETAVARQ
jgi:small neutral amino acid transporter SnatA (MarC family)